MKMNKITTLSIIFSIIIVSISFSFFMDAYITIYDPDWYGLMNFNKEIPDKKKIFLLGSSSAYAVSATLINEKLEEQGFDFEFYNLADMSDKPQKRLKNIQNILNKDTKLILYGIGIYDFEIFQSKLESTPTETYLLDPHLFFKFSFEELINNNLNEQFPLSPKDRILTLVKYVLRGPDQHYHPFIKFDPTPINDFNTNEKLYGQPRTINSIDVSTKNPQILALNEIISKCQNQGIKLILFTNPNSKLLNQGIANADLQKFEFFMQEISKNDDLDVYFLHNEYSELNIWKDALHIAIHPNAGIFTDDISEILLDELENNAV